MSEATTTQRLQACLDRLRTGDAAAREELFGIACDRLTVLTRKMLHRGYERLRQWEQTEDVAQNAKLRLLRTLEEIVPGSVRSSTDSQACTSAGSSSIYAGTILGAPATSTSK